MLPILKVEGRRAKALCDDAFLSGRPVAKSGELQISAVETQFCEYNHCSGSSGSGSGSSVGRVGGSSSSTV